VSELLKGVRIDMPPAKGVNVTFKKAPKAKAKGPEQGNLPLES